MSSRALSACLLVLTGCSGAGVIPPEPPARRPTPPTRPAPVASAPLPSPSASSAPATAPPAPPLPLPRSFTTITLPGVRGALIGVAGRSADDLWFVSDEVLNQQIYAEQGVLIHFDGKRVLEQSRPPCGKSVFQRILLDREGILLPGRSHGGDWGFWQTARRPFSGGKWACDTVWSHGCFGPAGSDNANFSSTPIAPGQRALALDCDATCRGACRFRGRGGRRVPHPQRLASSTDEPAPRAWHWQVRDDGGWMVLADEDDGRELLRFDGVAWTKAASLGDLVISAMWIDERDHPWLLAGGAVLHFDGRALIRLPVPEGIAATVITGSSARDVWFFGPGRDAYQWDGERLHHGLAPFDAGDAWAAPNGEVWIVGRWNDDEARGSTPAGVVARTTARVGN